MGIAVACSGAWRAIALLWRKYTLRAVYNIIPQFGKIITHMLLPCYTLFLSLCHSIPLVVLDLK